MDFEYLRARVYMDWELFEKYQKALEERFGYEEVQKVRDEVSGQVHTDEPEKCWCLPFLSLNCQTFRPCKPWPQCC